MNLKNKFPMAFTPSSQYLINMDSHLSKTATNKDATILIIEDNPINLRILLHVLMNAGFNVLVADAGEPGLLMAYENTPDIILLDVILPGIDGFEVCRQLKINEVTQAIPIIFITGLTKTENIVQAFEIGAVDYITKPLQAAEVLARINTHLTMNRLQIDLANEVEERGRLIEELNAFAHMVAHDLKNPLGNIVGFANILQKEYGRLPQDEIQFALDAVSDSAYKMSDIIDALLSLARVRQSEVTLYAVEMDSIITEVLKRLKQNLKEANASIECPSSWPQVMGHRSWIEEVWVNYISNAIKYGGDPPQISLGWSEESEDFICFWVQDNGPGLTTDQQEKLFRPFTRFNQDKVEGHGLGLSIVQRIVLKLGGHVGIESTPGAGSKFLFSLPSM